MQNKGYSQDFIDRVRNANNIVDIARTYLPLKQKGQDYWACCPFHNEKTPSFAVSGPKQFYYCYGCHESGNVFKLVQKMENLSWHEAVEMLAKRANIEIPVTAENGEWMKARRQKEKIYQALLLARDYYCQRLSLPQNQPALNYLHQRGIDDDLIKLFHIGYSDSWRGVVEELKRHGIDERTMLDAGIVKLKNEGNRQVYDAQFERITFSIHDVYGNCIGFTGRTMKKDDNLAKYKNTAETAVFHKGNIVYGIDVMKEKTRGKHIDGVIVVEGNVDEIAMIKHGFDNTVACMGTALTKFHAGIMSRFGKVVYLCLDGDNAGQKATLKSIDVLQDAGLTVKVISLPNGQDPDDFLRNHGADAMRKMLINSVGGLEFKLNYIKQISDLSSKVGKANYLNQVVALLAKVESPAERALYFGDIAAVVDVEVEAIRNTVNSRITTISSDSNSNHNHKLSLPVSKPPTVGHAILKAEQTVVKAILHQYPYADINEVASFEFSNPVYQKIITEDLKLNDIDDKLSAEELSIIQPLIIDRDSGLSDQERKKEWEDCVKELLINQLKQKAAASKNDLVQYMAISKQIKMLEQQKKNKVEESTNGN